MYNLPSISVAVCVPLFNGLKDDACDFISFIINNRIKVNNIRNFLKFLILLTLILLLMINEIKSQASSFKPLKRGTHTATLIDGKLYILGGYTVPEEPDGTTAGEQFFYLDVS